MRFDRSAGYEDIAQLRQAFTMIDTNGNGIIDRAELKAILVQLRVPTSDKEINQLFNIFVDVSTDQFCFETLYICVCFSWATRMVLIFRSSLP